MSKIRINELARQLEIPSHVIVEMLPEVGVTEKKTHSSSIDEPVAELVRKRVHGEGITQPEGGGSATAVEEPEQIEEQQPHSVAAPEQEPPAIAAKSAPAHAADAPDRPAVRERIDIRGARRTASRQAGSDSAAAGHGPKCAIASSTTHGYRNCAPRACRATARPDTLGTAPAPAAGNADAARTNACSCLL